MIKLSRLTDYAVVLLAEMARQPAQTVSAPELGEATGVPQATVAKVLKLLQRGGCVASQRGAAGGYALARPAAEITVAEIIAAMEGPIALTACLEGGDGLCSVQSLCGMRGNWDKINSAIKTALSQLTLADMATPRLPPALPRTAAPAPSLSPVE
ncbi:MAG TPA: SUF system Fe-S cluster assembly regulator [Alphaproteobacteria bacterium]|nr:SUF system Fe-S cluster assembly regulator [Alphaproteobacteria bacterium]